MRVYTYFSAYVIKIIKKYIKIPNFEVGLMVIPIIQPLQPVANYFQLIETNLRGYKSTSYAWPEGERNLQTLYSVGAQFQVCYSRASCTSQIYPGNPFFLEMLINVYYILCAHILEGFQRGKGWMDPDDGLFEDCGRIQVISPLFYYCTCHS